MNLEIFYKTLLLWLCILLLAIANGVVRERLLIPRFGSFTGLIVSGRSLSLLILLVAYAALPWLCARQDFQYFCVGLAWLLLTLIFEFGFGLAQHKSSQELFQAYTLKGGNLWSLVLVVMAAAPWLAAKLRDVG